MPSRAPPRWPRSREEPDRSGAVPFPGAHVLSVSEEWRVFHLDRRAKKSRDFIGPAGRARRAEKLPRTRADGRIGAEPDSMDLAEPVLTDPPIRDSLKSTGKDSMGTSSIRPGDGLGG